MCNETLTSEDRHVLDTAMEAGRMLLENGAEISRVEETMERICRYYGIRTSEQFILSHAIFMTSGHGTNQSFARVTHIPVKGTHFDKVAAINQLSREISAGKYPSIDAVEVKLRQINNMPAYPMWLQVAASGLASGFFCALIGGSLIDSVSAFVIGLILYIYTLKISLPYLGKIVGNILGGMLIVLLSLALYHVGFPIHLSSMISGTLMPLVPGVAFTNGIRDIANGDYVAGPVRILDAVLVFLSLAIGMGVMFSIYHMITGGIMP